MSGSEINGKLLTVSVNNVDLSYRIYGQGNEDLLCVHGYLGQGSLFQTLFSQLEPYFKIIALDLRAHGSSAHITENFTLNQLAEDIVAVVNALKLNRPFYMGHSLGGVLGLLSELKQPGIFKALALITPAPAKAEGGWHPQLSQETVKVHKDREAMRGLFRSYYMRAVSDQNLNAVVDAACLMDTAVHQRYLTQEWPKHDVIERISEINSPVLMINGALDNVIPLQAQHQMALQLPNCKEVIFSDEGHMLPLESPKRVAREFINFYKTM